MQGRPDFIVWGAELECYDLKTGAVPNALNQRLDAQVFESDGAQVLAYNLLLEERFSMRPHGYVLYAPRPIIDAIRQRATSPAPGESLLQQIKRHKPASVPFTPKNRRYAEKAVETAKQIKAHPQDQHRTHNAPLRCRHCVYREQCPEALS